MKSTTEDAAKRAFKLTGIDLSGYMCKDGARAIAWYRDTLGLEPSVVYPDNRGAEYDLPDGTTFGLFGGGGKVMPFQPSNGILFAVDDLDAALADLKSRGIEVVREFQTPNCRMAGIADSEGNLVFLHKRNTPL
jgi:predicted enzyme related to lactoylglutathione lyase